MDMGTANYSIMTAHLYFRRRTLFFSFNFIIPCLIISICSIFGFMLPPESGEKIGLRIYILKIYFFTIFNLVLFK
jgi:nicotinic acetylcholine receptor, invertebrate